MRKRLALVACYGSLTGPWVRINPADKSLHVTGLGKGERIFIDSIPSTVEVVVIDSDGMFPLPTGAERIPYDHARVNPCLPPSNDDRSIGYVGR